MMSKRVTALAVRRIDASDAKVARFPLSEAPRVRRELRELFIREGIEILVCAAACGADLIALEQASELGIRCRIVLPFAVNEFRFSSVVDRPGEWGPLFDAVVGSAALRNDLVLGHNFGNMHAAFILANERILQEASLQTSRQPMATIVWDGASRGADDVTAHFATLASELNFSIRTIETC
jgi:hypothetical protein